MLRDFLVEVLDRQIETEQVGVLAIIPHNALNPEKGARQALVVTGTT